MYHRGDEATWKRTIRKIAVPRRGELIKATRISPGRVETAVNIREAYALIPGARAARVYGTASSGNSTIYP